MSGPYARALLVFHHIRSPRKKAVITQSAKDRCLSGICKVGYPGVLAFEGEGPHVRDYIRQIKALRWQQVNLASLLTGLSEDHRRMWLSASVSDKSPGILMVDKMSQVGYFMKDHGLEEWWRTGMGYSRK